MGVKVAVIAQLAPALREAPQVFDCANSPPLVPVTAKAVMFRVSTPLLVKVTICAALVVPTTWALKLRLVAERLTPGPVLVPVKLTACGLSAALSLRVSVPLRAPKAEGVKVTLIIQLPPAALTTLPQLLD